MDAWVYGHTTTAIYDIEVSPPPCVRFENGCRICFVYVHPGCTCSCSLFLRADSFGAGRHRPVGIGCLWLGTRKILRRRTLRGGRDGVQMRQGVRKNGRGFIFFLLLTSDL